MSIQRSIAHRGPEVDSIYEEITPYDDISVDDITLDDT